MEHLRTALLVIGFAAFAWFGRELTPKAIDPVVICVGVAGIGFALGLHKQDDDEAEGAGNA